MYITHDEYTALYGTIEEKDFIRLEYDAARYMDKYTTGLDGVKKLRVAFPSGEDAEAVKHCAASLIKTLQSINEAEQSASFAKTENGLQGKVISSVSSGSESITYSVVKNPLLEVAADPMARDRLMRDTIRDYLSGVQDANGVNLLYMGRYPRR